MNDLQQFVLVPRRVSPFNAVYYVRAYPGREKTPYWLRTDYAFTLNALIPFGFGVSTGLVRAKLDEPETEFKLGVAASLSALVPNQPSVRLFANRTEIGVAKTRRAGARWRVTLEDHQTGALCELRDHGQELELACGEETTCVLPPRPPAESRAHRSLCGYELFTTQPMRNRMQVRLSGNTLKFLDVFHSREFVVRATPSANVSCTTIALLLYYWERNWTISILGSLMRAAFTGARAFTDLPGRAARGRRAAHGCEQLQVSGPGTLAARWKEIAERLRPSTNFYPKKDRGQAILNWNRLVESHDACLEERATWLRSVVWRTRAPTLNWQKLMQSLPYPNVQPQNERLLPLLAVDSVPNLQLRMRPYVSGFPKLGSNLKTFWQQLMENRQFASDLLKTATRLLSDTPPASRTSWSAAAFEAELPNPEVNYGARPLTCKDFAVRLAKRKEDGESWFESTQWVLHYQQPFLQAMEHRDARNPSLGVFHLFENWSVIADALHQCEEAFEEKRRFLFVATEPLPDLASVLPFHFHYGMPTRVKTVNVSEAQKACDLLQVDEGISESDLRARLRQLRLRYHPDKYPMDEADMNVLRGENFAFLDKEMAVCKSSHRHFAQTPLRQLDTSRLEARLPNKLVYSLP
jgi:hypothetical protein